MIFPKVTQKCAKMFFENLIPLFRNGCTPMLFQVVSLQIDFKVALYNSVTVLSISISKHLIHHLSLPLLSMSLINTDVYPCVTVTPCTAMTAV